MITERLKIENLELQETNPSMEVTTWSYLQYMQGKKWRFPLKISLINVDLVTFTEEIPNGKRLKLNHRASVIK